jgi:hypothetical protein
LTEQGLHTVGLRQELAQVVDASGRVDFTEAARLVMQNWSAAAGASTDQALHEVGWLADDAARDQVTAGLAQAYAQGALTREELDARTSKALIAGTVSQPAPRPLSRSRSSRRSAPVGACSIAVRSDAAASSSRPSRDSRSARVAAYR